MAKKSIYDVYSEAGKAEGEYGSKWKSVEDVEWNVGFSEKKTRLKQEKIDTFLDTLQAGVETFATVGGSYAQRAEDISMIEEATGTDMQTVTKYGDAYGDLNPLEKLWHGKSYQFGEGVMSKSQLGFAATQAEAGMKIDLGAKKYKPAERKDYWGEYKGPDIFKGKSPFGERTRSAAPEAQTATSIGEGEDWQDMEDAARKESEKDFQAQQSSEVEQGLGQTLQTVSENVSTVDTGKDIDNFNILGEAALSQDALSQGVDDEDEMTGSGNLMKRSLGLGGSLFDIGKGLGYFSNERSSYP